MYKHRKTLLLLLFVAGLAFLWLLINEKGLFTFEFLKNNLDALRRYVAGHYTRAAVIFTLLYLTTALIVPGALVLTVAGGMLFGTLTTVCLINIGATLGAAIAFYAARFMLGNHIQEKFRYELIRLNFELERHGLNYLLVLRIIPIVPAFVVNYIAGLTKIQTRTFIWTTSAGVFPGSLIYAFAGSRLSKVESPEGLLAWPIIMAFVMMALFALLPVIIRHGRRFRRQ